MDFLVALKADKGYVFRRVGAAKGYRVNMMKMIVLSSLYMAVAHGAFVSHSFQYFISHPAILDGIGISSPG